MVSLTLEVDVAMVEETEWASWEALLVALRRDLPARAVAEALEVLQDELIDRACGPKWYPVRGREAPFACTECGVCEDFCRKGRRTRLRKFKTAAGPVEIRLWNVGCGSCGRVFAPLLQLLGMENRRRTDRLTVDLAQLGLQMSYGRTSDVATSLGLPTSKGQVYHSLADAAAMMAELAPDVEPDDLAKSVVLIDGTGVRAGTRALGTSCNLAIALDGRTGPKRRPKVDSRLLAVAVDHGWPQIESQLEGMCAPALVVIDGESAITEMVQRLWPAAPIQRCWWHLPRGLRQMLYADGFKNPLITQQVSAFAQLLRDTMARVLDLDEASAAYDTFAVRREHRDRSSFGPVPPDRTTPCLYLPRPGTSGQPQTARWTRTWHRGDRADHA